MIANVAATEVDTRIKAHKSLWKNQEEIMDTIARVGMQMETFEMKDEEVLCRSLSDRLTP